MADFAKVLDSNKDFLTYWNGIQVVEKEASAEEGNFLTNFKAEDKKEGGCLSCVKAWASWFFNAVLKVITLGFKGEFGTRPACSLAKKDVKVITFGVEAKSTDAEAVPLAVNQIALSAFASVGVNREAAEKKEKAEDKSKLDLAMTDLIDQAKKVEGDLNESLAARVTYREVKDGAKEAKVEFLVKGAKFDDKEAKVVSFTFKA